MKYIKSILSVMLVTVFIITSGINSSALELSEVESGIYEVQNDVNHESEIGMSMARSYLDPTMKLEIKGGKVYYTIKFSGANYMKDHKISINGENVNLDIINEDNENHTIELGFETDTIEPDMKASMYVDAMGRDVEFGIITKTDTLNLIEKIEEPKEEVLLLGDGAVNRTIPLILCGEEDVEGNHGASIGELDEKTLFYLMSRGFTKEAAEKMIARARLDAVAGQIKEPSIREKTLKYLEERQ